MDGAPHDIPLARALDDVRAMRQIARDEVTAAMADLGASSTTLHPTVRQLMGGRLLRRRHLELIAELIEEGYPIRQLATDLGVSATVLVRDLQAYYEREDARPHQHRAAS